jgi:hypothetical protein
MLCKLHNQDFESVKYFLIQYDLSIKPKLMNLKVIITGATGMVGEGVLLECLSHPAVEKILLINRKPSGYTHAKIKEIVYGDFFNLNAIENHLAGYNSCFFCLGVSSVGMKEDEYRRYTYDLTLNFAKTVSKLNPEMTFCYISGAGTASDERGSMWAKVKGKTENDLKKLPFKNVYLFRPAFLKATPGAKNTLSFYKYVSWMIPLLNSFFPKHISSLRELGQAMIAAAIQQPKEPVFEVVDIKRMSKV